MDTSINEEVRKKAEKIIAGKEAVFKARLVKSKYLKDCHTAGICPICGKEVKSYHEKRREAGWLYVRTQYIVQDCPTHGRTNSLRV